MECACQDARNRNMDLKASVRHMGNAFVNGIKRSQEEGTCLVLQLPVTRMSRQMLYLHTDHPNGKKTFLLKD